MPVATKLEILQKSIVALSTLGSTQSEALKTYTIEELFGPDEDKDCQRIGNLFTLHGSDKSTVHNYNLVYGALLRPKRNAMLNILEIGLGTNNIDLMSSMGLDGKPGASLRAFRDMYQNAQIFGADIDKRILFTEERIKTFFVDQTMPETLEDLRNELLPLRFDLIIDDGLHNSHANLNTLNFALGLLKKDGMFIIEDVHSEDKVYYQIVAALLLQNYKLQFLQTRLGCVVVIKGI